jgi:hypothetical protein
MVDGPISAERRNALVVLQAEQTAHANGEKVHVSKLPGAPAALRGLPAL